MPDEIGQLSRAFDCMTESLGRINAELKQKAADLETANKEHPAHPSLIPITLHKRQLRQKAADLETANEELESFSYSVSHDLRAPLRHITGFVELLQAEAGEHVDEKGRRYMKTIAASARKMGLLIDDLLAFSRIGRSDMRMRVVSVEKLVKEAIAELGPEIKDRDISWENRSAAGSVRRPFPAEARACEPRLKCGKIYCDTGEGAYRNRMHAE